MEWDSLGSSSCCGGGEGELSVIQIFKALSAKSRAETHIIFVAFQVTQRQMGQEVENIYEEADLSLVAA